MDKDLLAVSAKRVLLLSMPWGSLTEPAVGPAVLKACLEKEDIACDVLEAQYHLLRFVTVTTYREIANLWAINDYVFAKDLDPSPIDEQRKQILREVSHGRYRQEHFRRSWGSQGPGNNWEPDVLLSKIRRLRDDVVPQFLTALMNGIDLCHYFMVGFSCQFDQVIPSLAFAQRIRQQCPGIVLAFGGAQLASPVGEHLQKAFPDLLDIVAYGDGEPAIVPLARAAQGLVPLNEVPNISYIEDGTQVLPKLNVQVSLDQSPTPRYDDYWATLASLRKAHQLDVKTLALSVETSRGCWKGEGCRCAFCGIDPIS